MNNTISMTRRSFGWLAGYPLLLAALLTLACRPLPLSAAEQERFSSPEAAARALITAAKKNDRDRLLQIFGSSAGDLVSSGDDVADAQALARFAKAAQRMRLTRDGDTIAILHFGKDDASFPIPLVKEEAKWRFDTSAGQEEIINRRIGRNELHSIAVCRAYVDAQREYASKERRGVGVRAYAQKVRSAPGMQDGLYWETSADEPESPIGPLLALSASEGYALKQEQAEPEPYYGYFFRILTAQGPHAPGGERSYIANGHMTGGFALVAYPAQYGVSGVMTFVVNQQGIVFQKDLGAETAGVASTMTQYNPDDSWQPVGEGL